MKKVVRTKEDTRESSGQSITTGVEINISNLLAHRTSVIYCKTLIFRVTLFSRAHDFGFIHETL